MHIGSLLRQWLIVGILAIITFSCQSSPESKALVPASDSTAGAATPEYGRGFRITPHDSYTRISVFQPFEELTDTLQYNLVPRSKSVPKDLPTGELIRTPVRSIIVSSSTHIALTEMLQANEAVSAMVGAQYAYSADIRGRLENGQITSFAQNEFNSEVALELAPDLVMLSAGNARSYNELQTLRRVGIAVFMNAEWLEQTPLGKAEWVRVMGALLGKDSLAQARFQSVAERYNTLKNRVDSVQNRPLVINNMPYKGAWFVSGGQSVTARLLADAGAAYTWSDNDDTGGLKLDFEAVYARGVNADIWINPGTARSIDDVLAADPRFKNFPAVQHRRVYNATKRSRPGGGNDYWENGTVRPDRVLADLITIFHPAAMPTDTLYFYERLPR